MRQIKYRQYLGEGNWHYWGYHLVPGTFTHPLASIERESPSQQFTGLLDKNGKEIYEGDVVQFQHTTAMNRKFDYTEMVYFEDCHFRTKTFYLCAAGMGEFEVIGNIHESPELLTH